MKLNQSAYACLLSVMFSGFGCHVAYAVNTIQKEKDVDTLTGFYIGANGGWGWSTFSSTENPFGTAAVADITPQSVHVNTNGSLFGGQFGYSRPLGNVVLGVEADLDGANIQGNGQSASTSLQSLNQIPSGVSTNGFSVNENTTMLGSVRGRIGTRVNVFNRYPGLAYFTAGYAWRQVKDNISATGNLVGTNAWSEFSNTSSTNTQSGYALGVGGELPIAAHWSVRCEYLFYGFNGSHSNHVYFPNSFPAGAGVTASTSNNNINAVRLGVNYLI